MQVFISHTHETKALAQKVGEALNRAGYVVWTDQEALLVNGGTGISSQWTAKRKKALIR